MRVYTRTDSAERFWAQVDKSTDPNGCWLWLGKRNKKTGYGTFYLKDKRQMVLAHRYAYELRFGLIFPGISVLHKPPCVNRLCVLHTYLGTHSDNMLDMKALGRSTLGRSTNYETQPRGLRHGAHTHPEKRARGERHGLHKFTEDDIRAIRAVFTNKRGQQTALAKQYGVSVSAIHKVVRAERWLHVDC